MASVNLRFFKGKKIRTYLVLLSGSGGMLRGIWKTAAWKPAAGSSLVEIGLQPIHDGMAHCLGSHLFYRLHLKRCCSNSTYIPMHFYDMSQETLKGEGGDIGGFTSLNICWTPTGKLVLGLVGTLREKTENDKISE